jgi:hypothetical protein
VGEGRQAGKHCKQGTFSRHTFLLDEAPDAARIIKVGTAEKIDLVKGRPRERMGQGEREDESEMGGESVSEEQIGF